jgi:hypothetical protein
MAADLAQSNDHNPLPLDRGLWSALSETHRCELLINKTCPMSEVKRGMRPGSVNCFVPVIVFWRFRNYQDADARRQG